MANDEILQIAKFMLDLFTLITTLNIAVLGAIVTIVEKIFTIEKVFKPVNKQLFFLSLILFIISLLFSLFALSNIPDNTLNLLKGDPGKWVTDIPFYGSIWSFFLGVGVFIVLSVRIFWGSIEQVQPKKIQNTNTNKAGKGNKS